MGAQNPQTQPGNITLQNPSREQTQPRLYTGAHTAQTQQGKTHTAPQTNTHTPLRAAADTKPLASTEAQTPLRTEPR